MTEKKLTGYPSIDKPWLKYYSDQVINAPLPECSAYEIVYKNNQDNLNRIAIEYYGKRITYDTFFANVRAVADSLAGLGIKRGNIVSVCMLNSLETIYLIYGLNKIGAVANLISGMDSEKELLLHLDNSDSQILFTLDIFVDPIMEILNYTNISKVVVSNLTQEMPAITKFLARNFKNMKPRQIPKDRRFISWQQFISQKGTPIEVIKNASDPAVICYTGGTTGGSKGVVLSNRSIVSVAQQYIWRGPEISRNSRWAQVLPLFIAYGVTCSLQIPLMVGMTIILRITGSVTIGGLCKFKPQYIIYGPAFWEQFADENQDIDLSFLIEGISGGDKLPEPVESKVNQYLRSHGCRFPIYNGYGMSEVGAAVSVNFDGAHELGSVGLPFVKTIISAFNIDTCEELPIGQEGEICINTPSVMTEYINNVAETQNIIRQHTDGKDWVHSGDLGYISEAGFVHISGRLKRYILTKYNGIYKKVFSLDIEKVLLKHPAINNCAVVPMANAEREQAPRAFIVLKKGVEYSDRLVEEISQYCNENLEPIYRPVAFEFITQFPRTKIGKIDYIALEKI